MQNLFAGVEKIMIQYRKKRTFFGCDHDGLDIRKMALNRFFEFFSNSFLRN